MIRDYNPVTDCYLLSDGKWVSRQFVEDMRLMRREIQRQMYWENAPWWKKLFMSKPY